MLLALHGHLLAEPDYPWTQIILQSAPPAPIVRQEIHRDSWAGLETEALVDVAWALLRRVPPVTMAEVEESCCRWFDEASGHPTPDRYLQSGYDDWAWR